MLLWKERHLTRPSSDPHVHSTLKLQDATILQYATLNAVSSYSPNSTVRSAATLSPLNRQGHQDSADFLPTCHGLAGPQLSHQLFSFALLQAAKSREGSFANFGTQIFASEENILPSIKTQTSWHTLSADAWGSFYFRRDQVACSFPSSLNTLGSFSSYLFCKWRDWGSEWSLALSHIAPRGTFIFIESIYLNKWHTMKVISSNLQMTISNADK